MGYRRRTGVIGVEDGMEHAVTDAPEGAHDGHVSGADLPLNPAPVEAVMKRLDSPGKRMAAGAGVIVFVLAFFAFAYAMGLGSMKNSAGISRNAAVAAAKIASAQPEAPAASYTPPQTTNPTGLAGGAPAQAAVPVVDAPAKESTEKVEPAEKAEPAEKTEPAEKSDSPGTSSSGSDDVLTGASRESQLPSQWKAVWSGSGKAAPGASWRGPSFKLKSGFVRCAVDFTASGGAVTVYLVRLEPGIGKWALLEGTASTGTAITSDPRSIDAGTYRLQVDGTATFKASILQ
jgi:hypothetical protein